MGKNNLRKQKGSADSALLKRAFIFGVSRVGGRGFGIAIKKS